MGGRPGRPPAAARADPVPAGGGPDPGQFPSAEVWAAARADPFLCWDSPLTAYERAKLVLLAPLALLRAAFLVAVLVTGLAAINVVLAGRPATDTSPVQGVQRVLGHGVVRLTAWGICLSCGIVPRIRGWEHMVQARKDRAIIAFNHISIMDAYVISAAVGVCSGVVKSAIATTPFIGRLSHAMNLIYVERAQKNVMDKGNALSHRGGNAQRIADRAKDPRYPLVILGPEATTGHGAALLKFTKGAFIPGRPILPLLLRYPYRHLNMGWGMVPSQPWMMARIMTQVYNRCHLECLPVYYPSEAEKRDPALYAENVKTLMAEALGVPKSDKGISHVYALTKADVYVRRDGRTLNNVDRYAEIVAKGE